MAEIKKNILTGKWSYKGSDKIYSKYEEPIKIDKSYNFNHKIMDILQALKSLEAELSTTLDPKVIINNNEKIVKIFNGLINLVEKDSLGLNGSEMKYLLDTAKGYALESKSRIELISMGMEDLKDKDFRTRCNMQMTILDKKKEIMSKEIDLKIASIVSKLPDAPANGEEPKEKS